MTLPTWYDTGTVSVSGGSTTVTGTGTLWGGDAIMAGDLFCDPAQPLVPPQRVASIVGNGSLELWAPWPGTDLTADAYEIRYVGIIERSTAQTRRVLEQLGEVSAYADIQVDDTAARLALETVDNPLRANYRVLVSDIGDGTAAIYSKRTAAYDNWTDPAPYSGPSGPASTIPGIIWRGPYSGATTYAINDGVTSNGSSFRKKTIAAAGTAPSSAAPPVDTADWEVLAAKGLNGFGTGDVVGPASAIDGDQALFDALTGKLIRSGGTADPRLSSSPVPIDMHFDTLAGIGWSASVPGGIVATTASSAVSTNSLPVVSATNFYVGQLICYVASDSQYYSAVVTGISGNTLTLDRVPPVAIASGAGVYNFYNNNAHPNIHGYACLVDDAIRQASSVRTLVYVGTNPSQWSVSGATTLTTLTTAAYSNPGSSVAAERGVSVAGSTANTGVVSKLVPLGGGTYETEVVVNPGNRTGGFSGVVQIDIIATFADGTTQTIGSYLSTSFGNAILNPKIRYRVPNGARVSVRVISPASGPWTFIVGMIRHYRIDGSLRNLNRGRHVVFGDSWAAGGDFVTRLTARLSRAAVINKGQSGDTSAVSLARFDTEMAGTNPAFVWVILGTNDVYASVTSVAFQANMDAITQKIQALGATPIIFNASVCDLSYVPAPGPRLDVSRQYALRSLLADQEKSQSGVFTPTWTGSGSNPAIGNGSISGVWSKSGRTVTNTIAVTMGSTTTYGSGNWSFGLSEPATLVAPGGVGVTGLDLGTSSRLGMTRANGATGVFVTDIATLNISTPTVPHTWAVGDNIEFTITFISAD